MKLLRFWEAAIKKRYLIRGELRCLRKESGKQLEIYYGGGSSSTPAVLQSACTDHVAVLSPISIRHVL